MKRNNLCGFFTFALIIISVPSVAATTIFVDPQKTTDVNEGDIFTVDVKVEDVPGIYAFQFYLKYDPSILYPVDGTGNIEINFLENLDTDGWAAPIVNHEEGFLIVYATYLEEKTKSGSGTLATITFNVTGKGYSKLDLYDIILIGDKEISPSVIDGSFDNRDGTPDEPDETPDEPDDTPDEQETTTTTTIIPSNYPQWSNLRIEPSTATPQNPVSILVDWYDGVGLRMVIIEENSTGEWVKHIVYGG